MTKHRYGDKKSLIILSISLVISAGLGGLTLYAIRFITDYAVVGNVEKLLEIAKLLLLVILFQLIFNILISYLKSTYLNKSMINLKGTYANKLFDLDIKNLNVNTQEDYLSHLSNDMDRYESRFYINFIDTIEVVAQLVVSMILLATINLKLLGLALILFVFFVVVSKRISEPILEKENIKSKSLQKYTNYINETLLGFFVIKQNQLEENRINKFKNLASQVQADNYEVDKKSTNIDAINQLIQITIIFALVFGGLYFAKKSGISLGMTLLAGTAFSQSIWPMQKITPYISQMQGISVVLKEFDKTLSKDTNQAHQTIKEIENISFIDSNLGYDEGVVLNKVNLEINKNDKVLILGSSGAGKSTILKSIRRQLPLKSGLITVNNYSIKDISVESYYRQLSIVDQIGFIFNGTLKDNITLYKENTKESLSEILDEVGLNDLDLNYQLKNNGSNLSGGQRARLLLARALYLDSSLIICDEIFASLDKEIGENIERNILSTNKTVINVSHIIYDTNISMYDKIYLVKDNEVVRINSLKEINDLNLILN